MHLVQDHPNWHYLNVIFVLVFSLTFTYQVFEDVHLPTKPTLEAVLKMLNVFFCVVFFLEFVLKVFALGFYAYIRNPWNCLDLFIVAVSMMFQHFMMCPIEFGVSDHEHQEKETTIKTNKNCCREAFQFAVHLYSSP